MRSLPTTDDESAKYEPLLRTGARVFVLAGPVAGSGSAWYQVLPLTDEGGPEPRSGWVALVSREGEPLLRDTKLVCPNDLFENFASLANLGEVAALSCYGSRELTFLAAVRSCQCSIAGPVPQPAWLASVDRTAYRLDAPPWLEAARRQIYPAFHPDSFDAPEPPLTSGDAYQVWAHYDDPAAATCMPDSNWPDISDPVAQIALCRMTLVVTRVEPFTGID